MKTDDLTVAVQAPGAYLAGEYRTHVLLEPAQNECPSADSA